MTGLGLVACVLALLWFGYIFYCYVTGRGEYVRGWASTIAVIVMMGGVQLLCIGMLGQYISRIFEESKRRPLYFVRPECPQKGAVND